MFYNYQFQDKNKKQNPNLKENKYNNTKNSLKSQSEISPSKLLKRKSETYSNIMEKSNPSDYLKKSMDNTGKYN